MKIVVIGGTGLVGSKVVHLLTEHGHDAVAAAPNTGVNTITGEGLAEALTGADVVVDVSNSPSLEGEAAKTFFQTATPNILAAERAAGVGHHVALSVVGTEELAVGRGYFQAKLAQEELIANSGIPYSIVHATQFFEFVKGIADEATDGDTVRVAPVFIQPMAAADVAEAVAITAVNAPLNGVAEVGGPNSSASTNSSGPRWPRGTIPAPSSRIRRRLLGRRGRRVHPDARLRVRPCSRHGSRTGSARPRPADNRPSSAPHDGSSLESLSWRSSRSRLTRLVLAGGLALAIFAAPVAVMATPTASVSTPLAACTGGEEEDVYTTTCVPFMVPNSPDGIQHDRGQSRYPGDRRCPVHRPRQRCMHRVVRRTAGHGSAAGSTLDHQLQPVAAPAATNPGGGPTHSLLAVDRLLQAAALRWGEEGDVERSQLMAPNSLPGIGGSPGHQWVQVPTPGGQFPPP